MSGETGVTVVTTLVRFSILRARLRAQRAPGIPCALFVFEGHRLAKLGRGAARVQTRVSRHCEERLRRSNPDCVRGAILDCFAIARNDVRHRTRTPILLLVRLLAADGLELGEDRVDIEV